MGRRYTRNFHREHTRKNSSLQRNRMPCNRKYSARNSDRVEAELEALRSRVAGLRLDFERYVQSTRVLERLRNMDNQSTKLNSEVDEKVSVMRSWMVNANRNLYTYVNSIQTRNLYAFLLLVCTLSYL